MTRRSQVCVGIALLAVVTAVAVTASNREPRASRRVTATPRPGERASVHRSGRVESTDVPFDVTSVIEQVHFAYRPDGETFASSDATFTARVSREGLRFVARHHAAGRATESAALELRTVELGRTGRSHTDASSLETNARGGVTVSRGEVEETYVNDARGVEQTWTLADLPRGEGDFFVKLAVTGMSHVRTTATGIHFTDAESGLGARYGHATLIDAAGTRTRIPATYEEGLVALVVPADVLESATFPAVLDPIISAETDVDSPVFGPATSAQLAPAVAKLGTGYFVVWADGRFSNLTDGSDILAARVDASGSVLDPYGTIVSQATRSQSNPSIASNGTGALVVWEDSRANVSGYRDIWGARISSTGAVVDADGFAIAVATNEQREPDVAWNGTEYLVVWQDQRTTPGFSYDIYGARVAADGTLFAPANFTISTAAQDQIAPRVASNGADFFVVWTDKRNSFAATDIYGSRVVAGVASHPTGVEVAKQAGTQSTPDIASIGTGYFAVWTDTRNTPTTPSAIFGTRIDATGTVLDAGGFSVAGSATGAEASPAIATDGASYLVAYQKLSATDYDIYAKRLSAAGVPLDANDFLVFGGAGDQSALDITYGTDFFAVAQDPRTAALAYDEISGARVTTAGALLDAPSIRITNSANYQGPYAISSNGTSYLVVFNDERGGVERDLYAARLSASGAILDPAGIAIGTGPGYQQNAGVASNGSSYLVAYTDNLPYQNSHVYAKIIGGDGTLQTSRITLSNDEIYQQSPTVASVGTDYYVVWEDIHDLGSNRINGSIVSAAGVVATPGGTVLCDAGGYRTRPRIATNDASYYVVWQDMRGGTEADVYGTAVSAAGVVADVGGVPIAMKAGTQSLPRIASNGSGYLVVWYESVGFASEFFGTEINDAGAVATAGGSRLTVRASNYFNGFDLTTNGGSYLLLWGEAQAGSTLDIYGTRITGGVPEAAAGYALIADPTAAEMNVTAGSGIDARYLIAYSRTMMQAPYATDRVRARLLTFESTPGATCGRDGDCDSNHCVDGVCCTTTCGGGSTTDCMACSIAKGGTADGTCTAIAEGASCNDGSACTATDTCTAGTCGGTGSPCATASTCMPTPPSTYVCGPCAAGTYSTTGTGSTTCTTCAAGSFSASGATSCAGCSPGSFAGPGGSACTPCTAGTFAASPNSAACAPHTICDQDEFQVTAPSATSDRICQACTACTGGQVVVTACSGTTDTVCGDAPPMDSGMPPMDSGTDDAGTPTDSGTQEDAAETDSGMVALDASGSDASDADDASEDAAEDASPDAGPGASGGGCSAGRTQEPIYGAVLLVGLALLARRRRAR